MDNYTYSASMQNTVYHNAWCRQWRGQALILAFTDTASYVQRAQDGAEQGRNHVFKVGGGSNSLV